MKKQTLSLFTAGVLLSVSSIAIADDRLSEYDTNGDGTISTEEIEAVRTADFNNADTDNNGLSLAEFTTMQATIRTRRIQASFDSKDTTTDSALSLAEFTANARSDSQTTSLTNVFNLADTDSNSSLSLAEYTALKSGSKSPVWQFSRLDSDSDQAITLTEYLAVSTGKSRGGKGGKRGGRR